MKRSYKKWDDTSSARAVYLWWTGKTYREIGEELGRGKDCVERHLGSIDWGASPREFGSNRVVKINQVIDDEPPASVVADRNRRAMLRYPNYTAAFFGDPLPGYSALDRRA